MATVDRWVQVQFLEGRDEDSMISRRGHLGVGHEGNPPRRIFGEVLDADVGRPVFSMRSYEMNRYLDLGAMERDGLVLDVGSTRNRVIVPPASMRKVIDALDIRDYVLSPDDYAAVIWASEQELGNTMSATDAYANGQLLGLQRARDIAVGSRGHDFIGDQRRQPEPDGTSAQDAITVDLDRELLWARAALNGRADIGSDGGFLQGRIAGLEQARQIVSSESEQIEFVHDPEVDWQRRIESAVATYDAMAVMKQAGDRVSVMQPYFSDRLEECDVELERRRQPQQTASGFAEQPQVRVRVDSTGALCTDIRRPGTDVVEKNASMGAVAQVLDLSSQQAENTVHEAASQLQRGYRAFRLDHPSQALSMGAAQADEVTSGYPGGAAQDATFAREKFDQLHSRLQQVVNDWNPHNPDMQPKIERYQKVLDNASRMAQRFDGHSNDAIEGMRGLIQVLDKNLDQVDSHRIAARAVAHQQATDRVHAVPPVSPAPSLEPSL